MAWTKEFHVFSPLKDHAHIFSFAAEAAQTRQDMNTMIRAISVPLAAVLASLLPVAVFHHCVAGDLMTPSTAARLGLEEVWRKQVSVPAGARSIVDQQIVAHAENQREIVEVSTKAEEGKEPQVLFRIAIDAPGPLGDPIGKEEAERLARREVRRLTRRYGELSISSRTEPRILLYTLASNGTVDCRDAESGAPVWLSHVGNQRLKYGKMGIDDHYLTLTNGGNLVQLDITNGEPIETVVAENMPLFGAINAGDYAIVPTIRNGVAGFPLSDVTSDPFVEIVSGIAMVPPVKSPSSTKIAWGTDRGFVYVMETSGEPSVLFRLGTDGVVNGRIASADGDRFFFGSDTGQAYALRATRSGIVLWARPYGEPFYKPPFLLGDMVLLPSEYGNLFALDQKTGLQVWDQPIPNVDVVLGGIEERIFVRLLTGSFAVLDAKTGKMLDIDPSFRASNLLINRVTDRMYFVNERGTVQCLRVLGADTPTLRVPTDVLEEDASGEAVAEADKKDVPGIDPFQSGDPFGAGAGDPAMGDDPFGAGSAPADDPFGAPSGAPADDPFGAPAGGAMDDPFGDPFGN